MRTLKLVVEYDGTGFHGFQTQRKGERTVQSVLEAAILPIVPEEILTLNAAGRTDTGVHALGQVVSFTTRSGLPIERWPIAVNTSLPYDIAVVSAQDAPDGFHARFSAVSRTYAYLLWTRRTRSALWGRYSMHIRHPLDIGAMRRAASELVGTHDFAAYAKAGGRPGPTTVRNLYRLSLRSLANGTVVLTLTANGFLRSMVRNIVGTLIEIGKGDLPYQAAGEILETRSRALNPCAPAAPQGLCLWRVDYKLGPTRPLAAASAGCMIDNGED